MMGEQLQLILTAYVVNFMLTSVQPHDQMVHQAVPIRVHDESEIRENFQNLFNSLAKNNTEESEIYHETLKHEAAKNQNAFDAIKGELQITRIRNAYKKMNLFKKRNGTEHLVPAKRDTESTRVIEDDPLLLEKSFVDKFDDNQKHFNTWELMRQWYYMGGMDALKRFCKVAHQEAGMGEVNIRSLITWPRTLNFRNKKYFAIRIDVVMYEIEESGLDNHGENPFFITRGRAPDCVFYLEQWKTDPHRYYLTKHVCGIIVHAGRDEVVNW